MDKYVARPKTDRTSIIYRLSLTEKKSLSRKLIATGFVYSRGGEVEPGFSEFLKALSDKPLEWFEKNFGKTVDS